jgi:hypothetical protein
MASDNSKLQFSTDFIFLRGRLIDFSGRAYLPAIYDVTERNLVLRCSRQVEKSTFLANTIVHAVCTRPGIQMLFVCPREEQARRFSRDRLLPAIEQSPLVRRLLLGNSQRKPPVMNLEFRNGSRLNLRAAYNSADACRGLSADLLLVDEFQDIAAGHLPVLQETLSHAIAGRTILVGTPKSVENHLEGIFSQSTAHEWQVPCEPCRRGVILDERCLGPRSLVCPACQAELNPTRGAWVARHPAARWGEGFWINHLMVPWLNYDDILERQRSYDLVRFKNEVLGLSSTTGDQIVTRAELEACCSALPMAHALSDVPPQGQDQLMAGIDWGGGGTSRTVLVIGWMDNNYSFQICRLERFDSHDDPTYVLDQLAQRCLQFRVCWIAADGGGNGSVQNRLLVNRLGGNQNLYAICYSMTDHAPQQNGVLWKWTVNRTASISALFTRIKMQTIHFPRIMDCGSFLDEFACEIAEYDDLNRTVKYTHPATQQDDALHATNYALLLATRAYQAAR